MSRTKEMVEACIVNHDTSEYASRLPHANSRNDSDKPRIAFYAQMGRAGTEDEWQARVELLEPECVLRGGAGMSEPIG
jgi:hypothetical protein